MQLLKAFIYKVGYPIARVVWFFTKPTTQGVRCLLINDGKVLLITHTYGSILKTTVGGGIDKGETPHEAVLREVREETGIVLHSATEVGTVPYTEDYKNDTIHVFIAETKTTELTLDRSEIKDAGWYPLDCLPTTGVSPLFYKFLDLAKHHIT